MEAADLFVVNKADRPGADKLRHEIEVTLGIRKGNAFRHVPAHHGHGGAGGARAGGASANTASAGWETPVLVASASKNEGIDAIIAALDQHHAWLESSGELVQRRRRRLLERTREVVNRAAQRWIWEETQAERLISERLDELAAGRMSPYDVAADLLDSLKQGERV
jgi:LAO/AO transport system kinase